MRNSKAIVSHASGEDQVLDIYSILSDVGKQWLSILLMTVSAVLISYVLLSYLHPLKYATSATMVVTNVNEDISISTSTGTDVFENLNYAADSASRLKNILDSKELKNTVAKELGLKKFEGSTSATTIGNSNLLEITVRANSPDISYRESVSILKNYMTFSGDLVGGIELTVLEKPKMQEKPESSYQNIKYAILCGGIVLVVLCFVLVLMSSARDTIRNSKELESKVDAKLLATIMHEEKHRKGKKRIGGEKASILITDPVTSFEYTEGMRKLATRVMNEMVEKNQKILLISSAMENEGKSTVSANVALAMAQIEKKVLLIDMDFRKPSIYKILNMQEYHFKELGDYLVNNENPLAKDLICSVPGTELSVVLNRKAIPQAMEKYADKIAGILEELKAEADYIIIDTAPISLVSDAEELATMVDTSMLVVRQHWVEAKDINDTIDALGGRAAMVGCVFNNARKGGIQSSASNYGYGGHYAE